MFAEKSWGSFRVLDVEDESLTIKVTLNPGHSMNYHSHMNRDEVWVVISGHRPHRGGRAWSAPCMWAMWCRCRLAAAIPFWRTANWQLIEVQLGKEISVHDKQKFPLEQETTR